VNEWIKELTAQIEAENRERDLELQNRRKALEDSIDS
jgi:hypothetical protein